MSQVEAQSGDTKGGRKIKWVVAGLLVLLIAIVVMNLPRGYSGDLSRIGKGQPAVVLVRDKNAVESMTLMNVLNRVRSQYANRMVFLLTDSDTPEGRAFIAANQTARITLVLFNASGERVKILTAPQTTESLQSEFSAIADAPK